MNGSQVRKLRQVANEIINERCTKIEEYVQGYMGRTEKRDNAIRAWLVQEVKFKIQNDLHNANCTIDAVVEVLAESGINIPDFKAKVDARKLEVSKRINEEADRQMREEMEARAQAAQEASAAATAQAEAVAPAANSDEKAG